jgi:hypothetical protein
MFARSIILGLAAFLAGFGPSVVRAQMDIHSVASER